MPETATTIEIKHGPEKVAVDPYLCAWSEFYFLTHLCHWKLTGNNPKIIVGQTEVEGEVHQVYAIEKGYLDDVEYSQWDEPSSVQTGQPTLLGLSGDIEDMILIPNGNTLETGRRVRDSFLNQVGERATSNPNIYANKYIQAQFETIKKVRAMYKEEASSYAQLYSKLKQEFVTNNNLDI